MPLPSRRTHGRRRLAAAALACGLAAIGVAAPAGADAIHEDGAGITVWLEQEPPQLDTTKATDQVSTRILNHVMEGLLRVDEHGRIAPGVAESWDITSEGATFRLRDDARWSDGQPVTAQDFVFAWRTAVDPATASEYAFIIYPIRHAEAINAGERPVTELGAQALDDRTLEVRFERPVAYFDKLVVFSTYFPVREDFHRRQNGRYGADAATLLYNGPFMLTRWVHGAHVRLERNPHYWDRDAVRLDVIDMPYVTSDASTALNLFKDGKVVNANLSADTLQRALDERWRIRKFNDGAVFFTEFNHRPGWPTGNRKLRRALLLATDPGDLVNRIIATPGNRPAYSLFPSWLLGEERFFLEEHPPVRWRVDVREARRLLAEALAELGLDEPPDLALLLGDSPSAIKQAEYYQNLYRNVLGLNLRLDPQIFKQRLAKMTSGDFDMVMAGWGPDFEDPMTFADLFASWNLNNRGRFASDALDAQVRIAQNSLDPAVRMAAFAEIQRLIYEDVVIIPSYERGITFVSHPRLRGLIRRVTAPDLDFRYAWIQPESD